MDLIDSTDGPPNGSAPRRMSASDTIMWSVERDPALRSTIIITFVLERAPDPGRLAAMLNRLIGSIPRLRQRVVEDPLGLAPPRWEVDPNFDPAYHMRHLRLPALGTVRDLYDLAAPIAADPFDRSRPLWEAFCVDGLAHGRFGIIWKVHHALADGQGLLWIMLNMIDAAGADDTPATVPPALPTPLGTVPSWSAFEGIERLGDALRYRVTGALDQARRTAAAVRRHIPELTSNPIASAGALAETVGSIARVLRPAFAPMSPLWRARSLSSRFDDLEVPLEALRRAARGAGGSINDGFLAASAGGLARYHRAHRASVAALRVGMAGERTRGRRRHPG